VSPKQLQPWAQVNHILGFKITHQVDINFPVGKAEKNFDLFLKLFSNFFSNYLPLLPLSPSTICY
jgi:hypothetical protein